MTGTKKGAVGVAEIFHVGKMVYEIRVAGVVQAVERDLSGASKAAERVNRESQEGFEYDPAKMFPHASKHRMTD